MSHVADVQMKVKDLQALRTTVEAMGATWLEGQTTHRWYGVFMNDWSSDRAAVNRRDPATFGKCEHAIKVPGVNYEIGVVSRTDGDGYDLVYDNFGSSGDHDGQKLEKAFGVGLVRIKQNYGVTVATRELARKGYRVVTTTDADGSIRVKGSR